ncbi:MAG: hypothetical protein ACJ77M_14735, partial [Thermoleophilaceae bacterium]
TLSSTLFRSRARARVAAAERAAEPELDPDPAANVLGPPAPDARAGAAIETPRATGVAATTAPTPGSGGGATAGAEAPDPAGEPGATGAVTGAGTAGSDGTPGLCTWTGADGACTGSAGPTPDAPVAVMANTTVAVADAAPARRRFLFTWFPPNKRTAPIRGREGT